MKTALPLLLGALLPLTAYTQLCGDCDQNGVITVLDALEAALDGADLITVPPAAFPYCDVDASGAVTVLDALRIAQVAVSLPVPLQCNTPPGALLHPPAPPVFGEVLLTFQLWDAQGTPADVRLELSTDGGLTYRPVTPTSGTVTTDLTAPAVAPPATHVHGWSTVADLGGGVVDDVHLRLTPTDGISGVDGTPSVVGPFDVSNVDVGTWVPVATGGAVPTGRYGAVTARPSGDRVQVLLGARGAERLGDIRELDLTTGQWLDPAAGQGLVPGRGFAAGAHDPVHQRTLVLGGEGSGGAILDDLQSFSCVSGTWSSVTASGGGPGARNGACVLYDSGRQRLLVLAGHDGVGYRADGWALDLAGAAPGPWTPVPAAGLPPRAYAAAVHDPGADRVLVFGGRGGAGMLLADLWSLDLSSQTWNQVLPSGPLPRPRAGAGMVLDAASQRLLVAGGMDDGMAFADVVALDLSLSPPRWRPIGITGPGPGGRGHAAWFLDPAGDLLVFGGTDPVTGVAADLWRLDR